MTGKRIALAAFLFICICSMNTCQSPLASRPAPWSTLRGHILYLYSPQSLALFSSQGPQQLSLNWSTEFKSFALSPDGERGAFLDYSDLAVFSLGIYQVTVVTLPHEFSSVRDIVVVEATTASPCPCPTVPPAPTVEPVWLSAWSVEWSPDGKWISFGFLSPSHPQIGIVDPTTGESRIFTPTISPTQDIHWLDSERLIFSTGDELWALDVNEDSYQRISPTVEERFRRSASPADPSTGTVLTPIVSHNGQMGAIVDYDPKPRVRVYHLRTGELLYDIAPPAERIVDLVWSPDDLQLAFVDAVATFGGMAHGHGPSWIGDLCIVDLHSGTLVRLGEIFAGDLAWSW